MKNTKIANLVFGSVISISYISLIVSIYFECGYDTWNFQNQMPTANVSPFMFFIVPIILILPNKIQKYFLTLISLLIVGMFFSSAFNLISNALNNIRFIYWFHLDYIAHFTISLWGIYIIRSKQISLNIKECLIGGVILLFVATVMLVINCIFDTSFFGLSLTGKHNIYNVVLVSNSYLSAFIYYVGAIGVMTLGYVIQKFINKEYKKAKAII
jgi:hypothetical protein